MSLRYGFVLALVGLTGCSSSSLRAVDDAASVTIMTFNVENLFDTIHDPGKDDFTYLPAAQKSTPEHIARCALVPVLAWREQCLQLDWNEGVLERKLRALAATILANGDDGRGPDILVLQEVENAAVVERLRRDHLGAAGYAPVVLVEGHDVRGIDVAFLTRLPLHGSPILHRTPFEGLDPKVEKDTRGMLEATFELPDGELLTGFAVHFPAPFHPAPLRVTSYEYLATRLAALPAGRAAFAAGDFNTIGAESWILDQHVERDWVVAHRLGCEGCKGTYYYARNDEWSFLDMVLVSPGLTRAGSWRIEPQATRVARAWPQQSTRAGTPQRFDPVSGFGVSDHWPIKVRLVRAESP